MNLAQRWENVRSSLFYIPLLFTILGGALAQAALVADDQVGVLPDRLTATVDSARSVLGVIAGATLAFAGIAFSVSLLLISAASSQFSPRVVHGLFRDPFNKRVMGLVVGTFVYCLIVMQAVRGPLEEAGSAVTPSLSVLLAVVLGVASILAIVGFINHSAHTMEVSTMLHQVTDEALREVRRDASDRWEEDVDGAPPEGDGFVVTFEAHGWVQGVDHEAILAAMGPDSQLSLDTSVGRYAISSAPLCRIWPTPDDEQAVVEAVRRAVIVGPSRSLRQDGSYGVRQLADVALKALSPGINDPTTAQDALFHMSSVVAELLAQPRRGQRLVGDDGQVLLAPQEVTPTDIVGLAFDEVRLAAASQPTVLIYLLEILRVLLDTLDDSAEQEVLDALRTQAGLVVEVARLADLPQADRDRVQAAYDKRFADV